MADQASKAEQFWALPIPGKPLVLFNIWDAGGAKAVARGGAKARRAAIESARRSSGDRGSCCERIGQRYRQLCATALSGAAAVDGQDLPRDPRRLVAGKEKHRVGDIGCLAKPSRVNVLDETRLPFGPQALPLAFARRI